MLIKMILPITIQNRTKRQNETYAIDLLKKKCEHYISAKYSDYAERLSEEIRFLLKGGAVKLSVKV